MRDHRHDCYYCDEPAESMDHIWPQSIGHGLGDQVPACMECNDILLACHPTSHILRMKELHAKLKKKYKKCLATPHWTEEELAEQGEVTRSFIVRDLFIQRRVERRLAFLCERIEEVVNFQDDLTEVGTEVEDYKPRTARDGVEGSPSRPHLPR
jgi:hypothetical protein